MDNSVMIGIVMAICGTIAYYYNFRKPEAKLYTRLGLVLIIGGTFLAVGTWFFNAGYNGR
jgi:hypothetical protein